MIASGSTNSGVSGRRPPPVLFLLGLKLAGLWALPLLVRAIVRRLSARRMAPFVLDDDRQSRETTKTAPANPGCRKADVAELTVTATAEATTTTTTTDLPPAAPPRPLLPPPLLPPAAAVAAATAATAPTRVEAQAQAPAPAPGSVSAPAPAPEAAGAAIQAAEVDNAWDISVALEWKLLFPLLVPGTGDPEPGDGRPVVEARCGGAADEPGCLEQAHDCVAQTIREAGEEAATLHSLRRRGVEEKELWASGWVVKKANSAVPLEGERARGRGRYVWVPVEICSPRMRLADPATRARMRTVLAALASRHRLAANCSCEVHVHLGRMDGRPWSLPTLQRLGSLLWAAEPTLRSIRDPSSPNFDNTYTWGFALRQRSRLARRLEEEDGAATQETKEEEKDLATAVTITIPDKQIADAVVRCSSSSPRASTESRAARAREVAALAEIWKAGSHLELGRLLSGPEKMHRRLGFNFSAFGEEDERARRNPRTMEFRIMDGSVDPDLILGWLVICGTIAEAAVVRSDPRFAAALAVALLQRLLRPESARHLSAEDPGERRAREFRHLMRALAVPERHWRGFEDKIMREHGALGEHS
ncbi:hypothetical protein MYCTH_2297177 [Thermothelomyces thermophilus ATCC 42464]|uniref:Amidoligase enzyme-domain-containing protein n=1 Tax=Thermothelomyces thermophilus (strain ATCC 42464 / BCRC 31852 / DSM 1799) TaxID=573729 RepID=G2Q4N6_THET4|nr:uncharacterized protein MYCTH_2297177 [Thermothelomyces thermophilus ATCC 42464]AEO54525.1 hypothetical protein MYCTH_2297177 [Thermothelomyces thermophilus ATCC 42464]